MGDFSVKNEMPFEMMRKASFSKLHTDDLMAPEIVEKKPTPVDPGKMEKLWKLMESYLANDNHSIQRSIINHVEYTLACTRFNIDSNSAYRAAAYSIRDRLIESFNDTNAFMAEKDVKRCYYLSLEFLIGRAMQNALVNLDIEDNYRAALNDIGLDLEELYEREHDAALGNGGLGRLAACFLDSMATLNYPCWGYGIRYTYGIFEQKIVNGWQMEHPDYWLVHNNPWEIERPDVSYAVRFYGKVEPADDSSRRMKWIDGEIIQAVACDYPIPGFDTYNTLNLRLWKSCPSKEFDFSEFNKGRYLDAVRNRQRAEYISAVLYPNDASDEGKELRLKQQYFFVCATMQDALRRFKKNKSHQWSDLPSKMVCQLNDTHPTIAIPEMMRLLFDIEGLGWEEAWEITTSVFCYTNHTVLPEALERWPVSLFEKLLPRHLLIINEINFMFLTEVSQKWNRYPDLDRRLRCMSIFQEGDQKMIRMANLAVIGCRKVNGVAAIHSEIVRNQLFPEFVEWYEHIKGKRDKFVNVTNGVTTRRWIHNSARGLSTLISEYLHSDAWLRDLDLLRGLAKFADDPAFQQRFRSVKQYHKEKLAKYVKKWTGATVSTEGIYDIQVKRIHEYKRQFMNLLWIIHRYLELKSLSPERRAQYQPRVSFMGGKAAPGYLTAKTIIKLANNISKIINNDNDTKDYISFYFLPNYNVSHAQIIIPASDISQHISTAGTEASGTSNMKFVMTGGRIIGTMDGANVEILEEGEPENMFVFGVLEEEVEKVRMQARIGEYPIDPRLKQVLDAFKGGMFSCNEKDAQVEFDRLIANITNNGQGHNGDYYLIIRDFPSYCEAQNRIDREYKDQALWTRRCILQLSATGKFSTDRTIREYAETIWDLHDAQRPGPGQTGNTMLRSRSFNKLVDQPSSKGDQSYLSVNTRPGVSNSSLEADMSSPQYPTAAN